MSDLDKDKVIADFTKNFKKAEGNEPEIEAKGGWYSVNGGKNMRLAQLQEWSEELAGNKKAKAETKKAEKKADTAKPKAKKAPAKKAKTAKKSKPKKGGFSVKDFWAEKLQQEQADARLPR